jgi:hypothetical protein
LGGQNRPVRSCGFREEAPGVLRCRVGNVGFWASPPRAS